MPDWPLISDLGPLGALPTAPRLARGFAAVVLNAWGLGRQFDVTELLVSELATNVVQASTSSDGHTWYDDDGKLPLLWVRLLSDRSRLMVEVWDNLPQALGAPVVRHPQPDEESGRGLEMVDALSQDWGWESVPGWRGKRVWAVLGPAVARFMALAVQPELERASVPAWERVAARALWPNGAVKLNRNDYHFNYDDRLPAREPRQRRPGRKR